MTLSNAEVLHKHYLEIGREVAAKDLEKRYPELAKKPKVKPEVEPEVIPEVKKVGKVRKG